MLCFLLLLIKFLLHILKDERSSTQTSLGFLISRNKSRHIHYKNDVGEILSAEIIYSLENRKYDIPVHHHWTKLFKQAMFTLTFIYTSTRHLFYFKTESMLLLLYLPIHVFSEKAGNKLRPRFIPTCIHWHMHALYCLQFWCLCMNKYTIEIKES